VKERKKLEGAGRRWEDIIEIYLNGIEWENVD
jgi:hypothetical protein